MKQLKVTQCQVGKFNILNSREETLSFYMGIYEDGSIMTVDGVKAILHYSGDADKLYIFEDAIKNIDEVFRLCYEDATNTISSTDYKGQCLAFAKLYQQHLEEIDACMTAIRHEQVKKKIEQLQKELLDTSTIYEADFTEPIADEIAKYKRWVVNAEKTLSDLKEGTEAWNKQNDIVAKYKSKIVALEDVLASVTVQFIND